MLDLHKLEIFALVAQEGSFSGAAERLLMTQSGVSQHIQDLEKHFGIALFQRSRRGVTLTPAGEQLLSYAQSILKLVAEAEHNLTRVESLESGQLTIGATPGITVYLMPEWLQSFRVRYSKLTVSLQTSVTSQIVAGVRGNRFDLGFIEGELNDTTAAQVNVIVLKEAEQYVAIGKKHPWWGRKSITISELDSQSFIMRQPDSQTRRWLEQMLRQFGVRPHIAAEFDSLELIKQSIICGTCLAILPDYVIQAERALNVVQLISIVDAPLKRTLKLVWAKERFLSPVTRIFLQELAEQFPQLRTLE
jgi:DNA-binding transcriptional LysR family regulator